MREHVPVTPELIFYHNWKSWSNFSWRDGRKTEGGKNLNVALSALSSGIRMCQPCALMLLWIYNFPMLLWPVSPLAEQHREEKIRVMERKAAVAAWSLAGRMREPHGGMKILSALACDGVFLLFFLIIILRLCWTQAASNTFFFFLFRLLPIINNYQCCYSFHYLSVFFFYQKHFVTVLKWELCVLGHMENNNSGWTESQYDFCLCAWSLRAWTELTWRFALIHVPVCDLLLCAVCIFSLQRSDLLGQCAYKAVQSQKGGSHALLLARNSEFCLVTYLFRDLRLYYSDDHGYFVFVVVYRVSAQFCYHVCSLGSVWTAVLFLCSPSVINLSLENVSFWFENVRQ